MNAIVVVDKNWCIGKDGGLLVHLSKDLKYFKEKTIGKTIIVGRKTLESFPGGKPLMGRKTIADTASAMIQLKSGALWMAFCKPPTAIIGASRAMRNSRIDVI